MNNEQNSEKNALEKCGIRVLYRCFIESNRNHTINTQSSDMANHCIVLIVQDRVLQHC